MKNKINYLFLILTITLLDQMTKYLILIHIPLHSNKTVIKGFFNLTHIRNDGAVWGLLSYTGNSLIPKIITILSLVSFIIIIYFFFKTPSRCKFDLISLSFIMGGAIGNILDRIFRGYVIDFLDFYIKRWHWANFNIADSFITIGVILLVISIWRDKCYQS